MIRVVLDAMGGDLAPTAEVGGAAQALRELPEDITLVLVGKPEIIHPALDRQDDLDRRRVEVVEAPEVITMEDKPLQAVRQKRHSSLVVGLTLVKQGHAQAFVSAGNTGAILAASTVLLGLHEGVERATVASLLPTAAGPVLLLDAGANLDCSARELACFAHLGTVYMRDLVGRERPVVGLLNVGEEDEKGTAVVREAHQLLSADTRLNYVGNIEGRDIVVPHPRHGHIDVVVSDGFTGNVVLKFYESMGRLVDGLIRRDAPSLLTAPEMKPLMRFLDYGEYGGAPLLGVKGVPIICHGSSSPLAIKNAIRKAVESARAGLNEHVAEELAGR